MKIDSRFLFIIFNASVLILGAQSESRAAENTKQAASRRASQQSKVPSSSVLAEAIAALDQGDTESAQRLLRTILLKTPNDPDVHTYLGVLADRDGNLDSAEHHFALAVRFAPEAASVHNNYGAILLRRNRTDIAAAQFALSLRLDPANLNALVNLAQIHFHRNTPEELRAARDLFLEAERIEPQADIARALIVISLRLDDSPAAASHYREYARRIAPTSAAATNTDERTELGQALLEGKLFAEAVEELNAALASDNSNVAALVSLARSYLQLKDVPSAGRTLEAAVARGLDDARLYATLSEVYERAGRPENAIPAMRLALAREPKSEAYHFRYAMLLTDTKAPAAAVIRLQESLVEFPRSSRLYLALGIAHLTNGKNADATTAFHRAAELDSSFAPAYSYLGAAHDERGEYAVALNFYEKAIAIDNRSAISFYLAAEAHLKNNTTDLKQVESYLQRSITLDPAFAQARVSLGKLLLRSDRLIEAAAQLQRAVELDPTLAQAYYQLGRTLQRLKRTVEAQNALAAFKRLSDEQKKESEDKRRDIVRRLADVRF